MKRICQKCSEMLRNIARYPLLWSQLILTPWSISTSGLLSEVGEHGGEGPPADVVRPGLTGLVAADGRELPDGLKIFQSTERRDEMSGDGHLEQSGVGVARVSPGEKFIKVLLTQDELHPLDIVRIIFPLGADEIYLVVIKGLHGLQHFPGQKYKSGGGGEVDGGQT